MEENKKELAEEELIQMLERSEKEEVKSLSQWLDYMINQAEKGLGALGMVYFFPNEIVVLKRIREEMQPVSHRLYVTESVMEAQANQIIGYNSIWRKRTLALQDFHPNKKLLLNNLNNIIVL